MPLLSRIPLDFGQNTTPKDVFIASGEGGITFNAQPIYAFNPNQAFAESPDGGVATNLITEISGDSVWEESPDGGIQPKL